LRSRQQYRFRHRYSHRRVRATGQGVSDFQQRGAPPICIWPVNPKRAGVNERTTIRLRDIEDYRRIAGTRYVQQVRGIDAELIELRFKDASDLCGCGTEVDLETTGGCAIGLLAGRIFSCLPLLSESKRHEHFAICEKCLSRRERSRPRPSQTRPLAFQLLEVERCGAPILYQPALIRTDIPNHAYRWT
jgi:hypothetical protein